jgi:hypothetical protein
VTTPGDAVRSLEAWIAAEVVDPGLGESELVAPYLTFFRARYGEKLAAVIFYGSCLSEATRSATSTPDFFVVTRDGALPSHSRLTRALHGFVPPASQSAELPGRGHFKYVYLDLDQLDRLTGPAMPDLFAAGRLSKRVKVIFHADEQGRDRVCRALASAVLELVPLACADLPERFSLEEYLRASVGISYQSEFRIEVPGKVAALCDAAPAYYRELYARVLAIAEARGQIARLDGGRFRSLLDGRSRERARRFLRASRRRALLRWPKVLLTMEHWGEVVLGKVERANPGLRFPEAHRRHPLLFAVPYLVIFLSRGYISTHRS